MTLVLGLVELVSSDAVGGSLSEAVGVVSCLLGGDLRGSDAEWRLLLKF